MREYFNLRTAEKTGLRKKSFPGGLDMAAAEAAANQSAARESKEIS